MEVKEVETEVRWSMWSSSRGSESKDGPGGGERKQMWSRWRLHFLWKVERTDGG